MVLGLLTCHVHLCLQHQVALSEEHWSIQCDLILTPLCLQTPFANGTVHQYQRHLAVSLWEVQLNSQRGGRELTDLGDSGGLLCGLPWAVQAESVRVCLLLRQQQPRLSFCGQCGDK